MEKAIKEFLGGVLGAAVWCVCIVATFCLLLWLIKTAGLLIVAIGAMV